MTNQVSIFTRITPIVQGLTIIALYAALIASIYSNRSLIKKMRDTVELINKQSELIDKQSGVIKKQGEVLDSQNKLLKLGCSNVAMAALDARK